MHAASLAGYALLALLSLRVLLPILLRLFAPRLSVGRLSPFGVGDISYTSDLGGSTPQERIRVHVGRVGWSCWGSKTCSKGWFVLKLTEVRITIPRAALLTPPRSPAPRPLHQQSAAAPQQDESPASHGTIASILHLINSRLLRPALNRLSAVASTLSSALVLFAVQIDFTIELEGTMQATGTLSGGVEVGGHLHAGKSTTSASSSAHDLRETRLGGWLALGNVEIHEHRLPPGPQAPSTPPTPRLPALAMRERLVLSLSAPLGPAGGFAALVSSKGRSFRAKGASVRVGITFGEGEVGDGEGVHVRIHELKRIVLSAEAVGRDRTRILSEHRARVEERPTIDYEEDPRPGKPSLLHFLRSVELSLPLFVLSAHYHTPLHILAASPKRPLPQSVAFAWTVKSVQAKLSMSGTSEDIAKEHSQFLGRGRKLGMGARLAWEEIEGRIKVDGSEGEWLKLLSPFLSRGS